MVDKVELRKWWKQNYPRDPALCKKAVEKILSVVRQSEFFLQAPVIGLFSALPWEIDIKTLWFDRPSHCVFPKVDPNTGGLSFYRIRDWKDMKPGNAVILEPDASHGFLVQEWKVGSLVLIPGRAFGRDGARVGSGKGYYDRFLAEHAQNSYKWGVCYHEQLRNERLAQEKTDVRMDAIVTDKEFIVADKR